MLYYIYDLNFKHLTIEINRNVCFFCSWLWKTEGYSKCHVATRTHTGRKHSNVQVFKQYCTGGRPQYHVWDKWHLVQPTVLLQTYVAQYKSEILMSNIFIWTFIHISFQRDLEFNVIMQNAVAFNLRIIECQLLLWSIVCFHSIIYYFHNFWNKNTLCKNLDQRNIRVYKQTPFVLTVMGKKEYIFSIFPWIADCGTPKDVQNAIINKGPTTEGSVRRYTCKPNTVQEGESKITCDKNGHWLPSKIYCRRKLHLPCLYSTFHLEYPLVLSRFCF